MRSGNHLVAGVACAVALGLGSAASAGTIVGVGGPGGNCYPYTCNDSGVTSGQSIDVQQIYSASAFSGVTTFNTLSYFVSPGYPQYGFPFMQPTILSGNYDIVISTTTDPVGSGYPIGPLANSETFFDGAMGGPVVGGIFGITGASYTYDPSQGNLVVEVIASDQPSVPNSYLNNGYFQTETSTIPATTRAFEVTGEAPVGPDAPGQNGAFVTEFSIGPAGVPEPATWAMMLVGVFGVGALMRRSRRSVAAIA